MKFDDNDFNKCLSMFNKGSTTSQVQEYLMNKYCCKRCKTSNFVKYIRKYLGIYNKNNPNTK